MREANSAKQGNKGKQQAAQCIFCLHVCEVHCQKAPFPPPAAAEGWDCGCCQPWFWSDWGSSTARRSTGCSEDKREGPLKPKKLEQSRGKGNTPFVFKKPATEQLHFPRHPQCCELLWELLHFKFSADLVTTIWLNLQQHFKILLKDFAQKFSA